MVYDIIIVFRQTLYKLADYYGVDPDALAEISEISVNTSLVEGERIKLPR